MNQKKSRPDEQIGLKLPSFHQLTLTLFFIYDTKSATAVAANKNAPAP